MASRRHRAVDQAQRWLALCLLLVGLGASGGTVETLAGVRYEGMVSVGGSGELRIQLTNGSVREEPLSAVRLARFRAKVARPGRLPEGWRFEDIGWGQGFSAEKDNVFVLEAAGDGVQESKQPGIHFAYRILRGDGEVTARVQSVTGASQCLSGVMLRESLGVQAGHALLGISPSRRLRLHLREQGWQPVKERDLGEVSLPVWLKLSRQEKDKTVLALKSADGVRWQEVDKCSLGCRVEPFPEGSDCWRPKVYAGLGILSGASNACSARLEAVALRPRGLRGEYYADSRFQTLRFVRPDGPIEFHWGLGSPCPEIEPDHFGIRWTGQVTPKYSESYRFHVDADNDAWLWLNGEAVPTANFKKEGKAKEMPLKAGQSYDIKLEFKEGAGEASVRLGWSSRSQALEAIPASRLSYAAKSWEGDVETAQDSGARATTRGIWLRGGSFLAGAVQGGDENAFRMAFAGSNEFRVANHLVARVVFRNAARAVSFESLEERGGLVLKNGDFLESEFKSCSGSHLEVWSLLLGKRTYSIDNGETAAFILHPLRREAAACEVRLSDGSVLRARALRGSGGRVLVDDLSLGLVPIPESMLMEIRASSPGNDANGSASDQPRGQRSPPPSL